MLGPALAVEETSKEMDEVRDLLWDLSIYPRYKGCRYSAMSVYLAAKDENLLEKVTQTLYPAVAELYGTNWHCVEHDIRWVVTRCWNDGGRPLLEALARRELKTKPTALQFIEILANHFARRWRQ